MDGENLYLGQHSSVRWKYMFQVIHNAIKFCSSIGSHTYMVFLPIAGNNGIGAGGITVHLILAHHGSCGILRYHKTGVQTGVGYQEFGQSAQAHDKLGYTPFGDIAQFGKGYAEEIERDGKRLSVEVTTGDDAVFVGEDSRLSVTEFISVSKTEAT